ncbi:MAG TPA: CotH kinase family protein [Candidatus Aminicenantes bacterium]|nr:CotH kinase family protein [Candidatus Aminicenantes bacterium]
MKRTLFCLILLTGLIGCSIKPTESEADAEETTPVETEEGSGIASGVNVADADLPQRIRYSDDGHRLVTGAGTCDPYYDLASIKRIDLTFSQSNWWSLLTANYQSETEIPAIFSYDGLALPANVGVRFKGFTSYTQNKTEKKSFNISLDYEDEQQDLNGFQNLNLNCAFGDNAFMREVVYENINQHYIPALANNYVELYINGEYWGVYVNSQQVDGDLVKEWFLSNDGTRWRAEPSSSTGQGGFGTGKSGLNYLGTSESNYQPYYTLKKAHKDSPWGDLVATCTALYNTSSSAYTEVAKVLDIDRTLWFLACENLFDDEDGYIHKGGTDYYLYWEVETGRMVPLEYDGNSTLQSNYTSWSPFYNATNGNFPLLSKLLAVPSFRQRYLAHYRTILAERFNPTFMNTLIDQTAARIDRYIAADPKKIVTYAGYTSALSSLKAIVKNRYASVMANSEVNVSGPVIENTKWTAGGVAWAAPTSAQAVTVTAEVSGGGGAVYLYGCTGVVGNFSTIRMVDDGAHGDGSAGDGVFGAQIPAQNSGTRVRFYIEAVASDSAATRAYDPAGAEHDVYVYSVQ